MQYGRRNIVDGSKYNRFFGKPEETRKVVGDNSTEYNVSKLLPIPTSKNSVIIYGSSCSVTYSTSMTTQAVNSFAVLTVRGLTASVASTATVSPYSYRAY